MQKLTFYIQTLLLFICKKNHVNKRAKWLKQEKKLAFVLWQGHLQALCSFQAWSQILQLESNLPGNCASVIIGLFSFFSKNPAWSWPCDHVLTTLQGGGGEVLSFLSATISQFQCPLPPSRICFTSQELREVCKPVSKAYQGCVLCAVSWSAHFHVSHEQDTAVC